MVGARLVILGRHATSLMLEVGEGSAVGSAVIESNTPVEHLQAAGLPASGGRRVVNLLADFAVTAIPYRRTVLVDGHVPNKDLQFTLEELRQEAGLSVAAYVAMPGRLSDGKIGTVIFLDASQYAHIIKSFSLYNFDSAQLETGQWVRVAVSSKGDIRQSTETQPIAPYLTNLLPDLADGVAQAYPLNELPAELVKSRPQHVCFLPTRLRPKGPARYISLSHPSAAGVLSDFDLTISAVPVYSASVPDGRIGVHETLLKSIGVRPGEPIRCEPIDSRVSRIETRVFAFRQAIARVGYSHNVDVGYAVARIPQRLLDVLGIEPGQVVIVQGLRVRARSRPARVRVRALPFRESDGDSPRFAGLQTELGVDDIEIVGLDLLRRQALGIQPGTPVIVRPALASLLAQEVVPISLAFATAVVGGVAQAQPLVVTIGSVMFLLFIIALVLRRFR